MPDYLQTHHPSKDKKKQTLKLGLATTRSGNEARTTPDPEQRRLEIRSVERACT